MRRDADNTELTVFAPATAANLSCGYDILGLAVREPGDTVNIRLTDKPGVGPLKLDGLADGLPSEAEKNTAGAAAIEFLRRFAPDKGAEIRLYKGLPGGSGMGSSAAGAAAALFALNRLLPGRASDAELAEIGMAAECVACGSAHGDNVIPSLFGGIILMGNDNPADFIRLPVPGELYVVLLHPDVIVETRMARSVLPETVSVKDSVRQSAAAASFVSGLFMEDYSLIGRSMRDYVAEPYRKAMIPGFDEAVKAAHEAGALGAGISGSGPSVFALCRGDACAQKTGRAMREVYRYLNIHSNIYVSPVNTEGPRVLPVYPGDYL